MTLNFPHQNRLQSTAVKFWREFCYVGLLSLITNLMALAPTLYMLQIYDRVLNSRSELTLLFLTIIVVLFFCLMALSEWMRSRILVRAGLRMDETLSPLTFKAAFNAHLAGEQNIASEAFNQLTQIRQFFTGTGILTIFDAPWAPIYIAVVFLLHPLLGWMAILFSIIQLAMTWVTQRSTAPPAKLASEAELVSRRVLNAKLINAESVEAMGMLENLKARWLKTHIKHQSLAVAASHQQKRFQSLSKFLRYGMQSLTLGAAAMLVVKGEISAGAMIAANVLVSKALQPLDQIASSWKMAIQTKGSIDQLNDLLARYSKEVMLPLSFRSLQVGQVSLNNIKATIPGRSAPILDGLNLTFGAGKTTVIMGPSGSGKSTLARCLVGVWPQVSGDVLYDGVSINEWDQEELGAHIGYLPQDIELLDGTIAENIGRFTEVDSEKVIEAAKSAGIHDMILRLPMGYDTPIMRVNGLLSHGQRQRLGLARALYGDPTIVVLDEPNANLDDQGEKALFQAITKLKSLKKTVFLITHRGSVVGLADQLLLLEAGKVADFGPKDEVITRLTSKNAGANNATAGDQNS